MLSQSNKIFNQIQVEKFKIICCDNIFLFIPSLKHRIHRQLINEPAICLLFRRQLSGKRSLILNFLTRRARRKCEQTPLFPKVN